MPSYIALIRKDEESCYGVDFPDFPGCISAGDTLDEAFRNAHQALALHMKGMQEDGDPIPEPSSLEQVLADPDNADAVPMLVNVAPPAGKAVRINITVDEHLLAAIDAYAAAHGKTRSGFIADAAREAMRS